MASNIKQFMEDVKKLSSKEKALIAHCLISSLDAVHDEGVDEAWASLAEAKYKEIASGTVQPVSWDDIKKQVTE